MPVKAVRSRQIALPGAASVVTGAVLILAASLAGSPSARADSLDVWTTYPGMSACEADLLNLNDYCYGLRDGRAIGLVDAAAGVDELDQSLGIPYDDENTLPAPEGPDNPVVQVWNNTGDYTFIASGTSLAADVNAETPVYYIAPHSDATGPALDADSAEVTTEHSGNGPVYMRIDASDIPGLWDNIVDAPYDK
jgi:hypothetical protein